MFIIQETINNFNRLFSRFKKIRQYLMDNYFPSIEESNSIFGGFWVFNW